PRRREAPELFEPHVADAGLLGELARGGLGHRLARLAEASGERPLALERLVAAANEEHAQAALVEEERDDVCRQRRARVLFFLPGRAHAGAPISSAIVIRFTPAAAISRIAASVPSGEIPAVASV